MKQVICPQIWFGPTNQWIKMSHYLRYIKTRPMTRFRNRIAVWSSLHESVLIYGSSHGSVFESPLYWVHNEHESGSGPGLLYLGSDLTERVRVPQLKHKLAQSLTNTHAYLYIHIILSINTLIHTYVKIYTYPWTHSRNTLTHANATRPPILY